jgi:hypothetical protein
MLGAVKGTRVDESTVAPGGVGVAGVEREFNPRRSGVALRLTAAMLSPRILLGGSLALQGKIWLTGLLCFASGVNQRRKQSLENTRIFECFGRAGEQKSQNPVNLAQVVGSLDVAAVFWPKMAEKAVNQIQGPGARSQSAALKFLKWSARRRMSQVSMRQGLGDV